MNYLNRYRQGFSLVEVLTAATVLAIVAAATYATFLSVIKLAATSKNELEGNAEASRWLERVAAAGAGLEYDDVAPQAETDLNDGASILQEDETTWPFATKPNVSSLVAAYTIDNVNLNSGALFRRVTITVGWEESS